MHIESPLLLLALLPIVLAAVFARWRAGTRVALALAACLLIGAAAGVAINIGGPARVVVCVDVSPSTRGATFRSTGAIAARLAALLPGTPVQLQYFADGRVETPDEVYSNITRLPDIDADAIILLSDGRLERPAALPPVFPLIDPVLDHVNDARIERMRIVGRRVHIDVGGAANGRLLRLKGAFPSAIALGEAGRVSATITGTPADAVSARLAQGDRWTENDRMTALPDPVPAGEWLAIGTTAPGARTIAPGAAPAELTAYMSVSVVVIADAWRVPPAARTALAQFAEVLGGSVVLLDPPAALPPELRRLSPLTATPPQPTVRWTVLLDASGSMATSDRWPRALAAARAAVETLDARERIDVQTFAGQLRTVIADATPKAAAEAITALAGQAPHGPTALRGALEHFARNDAAGPPRRLLVISDADASVDPVDALARQFRAADVQPFLLATATGDAGIDRLVQQAGGTIVREADPGAWTDAVRKLAIAARGEPARGDFTVAGEAVMAGLTFHTTAIAPAFLVADSERLARSGESLIVARRSTGLGATTAFAAVPDERTLAEVLRRLATTPIDPRLSIDINRRVLTVLAEDQSGPINGLKLGAATDAGTAALMQMAPGRYELVLKDRAKTLALAVDGRVVARRSLPGVYPVEYAGIGNDRQALADLADQTGGRVIEPGDRQPIALPRRSAWKPLDVPLAVAGFVVMAWVLVRRR